MHLQMRYQNGRLNKAKAGALAFFGWAALDVTASTIVALIFKMKETEVRPSWLLGPIVFNPVSVPLALAVGCVLWRVGRWRARSAEARRSLAQRGR